MFIDSNDLFLSKMKEIFCFNFGIWFVWCWVETGRDPEENHPGRLQIYNPSEIFLWTRLRLLWLGLWLILSLKLISSQSSVKNLKILLIRQFGILSMLRLTYSCWDECSTVRPALPSLCLLRWSFWWSLSLVGDKRTLFTRRLAGPWTGAHPPTKIFRDQVFFDNDPSSAASLRSATRKWVKDGWLWGF